MAHGPELSRSVTDGDCPPGGVHCRRGEGRPRGHHEEESDQAAQPEWRRQAKLRGEQSADERTRRRRAALDEEIRALDPATQTGWGELLAERADECTHTGATWSEPRRPRSRLPSRPLGASGSGWRPLGHIDDFSAAGKGRWATIRRCSFRTGGVCMDDLRHPEHSPRP